MQAAAVDRLRAGRLRRRFLWLLDVRPYNRNVI